MKDFLEDFYLIVIYPFVYFAQWVFFSLQMALIGIWYYTMKSVAFLLNQLAKGLFRLSAVLKRLDS